MLLLTMNEWLGAGKRWPAAEPHPTATERQVAFATRLPLVEALERVRTHQAAYNARYTLAVNFRLLTVSETLDVPDDLLTDLQVEIVEKLQQCVEDFNA